MATLGKLSHFRLATFGQSSSERVKPANDGWNYIMDIYIIYTKYNG